MSEAVRQLMAKFQTVLISLYRMREQEAAMPPGTLVSAQLHGHEYYFWKHEEDGRMQRTYIKVRQQEAMRRKYQEKTQLQQKEAEIEHWLIQVRQTLLTYGISPERLEEEAMERFLHKEAYMTQKGETVLSESEQRIANALWTHQLEYSYHEALFLGKNIYWPTFQIRHQDRTYYWEHNGSAKSQDFIEKYNIYMENGIILGRNLILTADFLEEQAITRILRLYELI